jgi:hypothetical protein
VREVHLLVVNDTAPSQIQLDLAVKTIQDLAGSHGRVAIHCGAGLGRAGTVAACYLVSTGVPARNAIRRVRSLRAGSINAKSQVRSVALFARRTVPDGQGSPDVNRPPSLNPYMAPLDPGGNDGLIWPHCHSHPGGRTTQ